MKARELNYKIKNTLKEEGVKGLSKKSARYLYFKASSINRKYDRGFKDILFINGCSLPHPQRYRVDHQIEQLESFGLSCDKIYYDKLTLDLIRYYRGFVFYRCPFIPVIEDFIRLAKENNKTIFYDIDDLVFDTCYTDKIPYIDEMSKDERNIYDDGVIRMGKTLDLCEYGIASTDRLKTEMSKRLKDVYINRNVASEEMVKYSKIAIDEVEKDSSRIIIGYLSGSLTHNDDFKLIMPSVIKVLKKYDNVYLKVVGLLDLPKEMESVKDKVITSPFVDWKELPKLIRSIDINLAPLEDSVFNEAKSENKWTEAALVKIPTIASNTGAFRDAIVDGKTGILAGDNEWEEKLSNLIENKNLRDTIGLNAYDEVMKNHVTTTSGKGITEFILSKLRRNICFVLPSPNISGGVMVAINHAIILKRNGYDVTMININKETSKTSLLKEKKDYVFVVPEHRVEFLQRIDVLVATMWLTLEFVQKYYNCYQKKYLVQNLESGFYSNAEYEKRRANATYFHQVGINYITISKWCQNWLKDDFDTESKYAPNGIDLSIFPYKKRDFSGKIKILIEGNSKDEYKNVDESFKIANLLDRDKFEVNYMSYEKEPKSWYKVDNFYHKVPHDKVGEVYKNNDILLKTSILESFSYPPLEMMATGGFCVVLANGGNVEYLKDNFNCLFYKKGNVDDAIDKINKIVDDKKLRNKLEKNGLETAKKREWKRIESDIISLYE